VRIPLTAFFVIFTLSGFSGLIYESIWSHYLKLLLGHAAYAQSLVLAIFMGGMAAGAWIAGRFSVRWSRLLTGYALVEGLIGLVALAFHPAFLKLSRLLHLVLIPSLPSESAILVTKWGLASALVLPQSILLGMTFPLMTAAVLRIYPDAPGRSLATLYSCNSLGAAAGVLASGFWLIGRVGLPGTILTAGLINLALALLVRASSLRLEPVSERRYPSPVPSASGAREHWYFFFLLVALITGAASFIYEIAWIRMLTMVLGAATHSFELMLSAFILGLALGGLWIRGRIDRIIDRTGFLALVQIIMGLCALASMLVYGWSFDAMAWLLSAVSQSDTGYVVFVVSSHALALAVMLPATICAGMTLPLITVVLLERGVGERSIGAVYAANTVGAILGVAGAVHLGLPLLGLENTLTTGAALDIALGIGILALASTGRRVRRLAAAAAVGCIAIGASGAHADLDARKTAAGVYRHGVAALPPSVEILFHRDGKTATIDLFRRADGAMTIATNGKPDASMSVTPEADPAIDEITMVLLGALPLALHPDARTAANIGLGAGLTSSILLASPRLEFVDTIEIEAAVVEAAKGFGDRVAPVYSDSRSRIRIADAKTYFALARRRYDLIVSEPSNPWVSGVASLFTSEFYATVRRFMAPGGVFVQWLQLYEIDLPLIASVMNAVSSNFEDYEIYFADNGNLLVAAFNGRGPATLDAGVFELPRARRELARVGIIDMDDLRTHRISSKHLLDPLFASYSQPPNSDYFPLLDLGAAKTRFLRADATGLVSLTNAPLPIFEMLDPAHAPPTGPVTPRAMNPLVTHRNRANALLAALDAGHGAGAEPLPEELDASLAVVDLLTGACADAAQADRWFTAIYRLMITALPHVDPDGRSGVLALLDDETCIGFLADERRRWLALFTAIAGREASRMAEVAADVLSSGASAPDHPEQLGYLMGVTMLGRLADGDAPAALKAWHDWGAARWDKATLPLHLRLLLALAASETIGASAPVVAESPQSRAKVPRPDH
jgi:spermidine synthase/MFS family permease